jgi:hypothetical protein
VDIIHRLGEILFLSSPTEYVFSYIFNGSKNVYPSPNISVTFIVSLEIS